MDERLEMEDPRPYERPPVRLPTVSLSGLPDEDMSDPDQDLEDDKTISAADRATLKLRRVRMLAEHARFHLGLCAAGAVGIVALAAGDFRWWKLLPVLPIALGAIAAAVVAGNLLRFNSVWSFRTRSVGPQIPGLPALAAKMRWPGSRWERVERSMFWLGVALFGVMAIAGAYQRSAAEPAPAAVAATPKASAPVAAAPAKAPSAPAAPKVADDPPPAKAEAAHPVAARTTTHARTHQHARKATR